jgi:hypothetical protein
MKNALVLLTILLLGCQGQKRVVTDTVFCTHRLVLDDQQKIVPWHSPAEKAYDHFLRLRWDFIKNRVPNAPGPDPRSRYPLYYFYSAFITRNDSILPDNWMNDIGEKIPNWFENARLFYAYTGDSSVMTIIKDFVDYTLVHGTGAKDFAWPSFPYTTTNPGDTVFRGFSNHPNLVLNEVHVDHAGEMGLTYFRMYQFTGDEKYLREAINVADILAKNAKTGSAEASVWPYRVVIDSGRITAPYGANWSGCYMLLKSLVNAQIGNVDAYSAAMDKAREFLLQYPMKTGYWTDGHTDTDVKSNTYKSNLSASNLTLCLFDNPDLDPDWKAHIPMLIKWTEDNFVFRTEKKEPSTMWGANIVGEQDSFNFKMDYQTARYAAECARWYALSGDETYREKAYRSLNWVTYCNDTTGMAFESPVSDGILSWWSDCYGECPRMVYHAFAGVPEWAPPREDHILYSEGILTGVKYSTGLISYTAKSDNGTEFLRVSFKPVTVTVNGTDISASSRLAEGSITIRNLGKGDYALTIKHAQKGIVTVAG